jgi:hypothetical protein
MEFTDDNDDAHWLDDEIQAERSNSIRHDNPLFESQQKDRRKHRRSTRMRSRSRADKYDIMKEGEAINNEFMKIYEELEASGIVPSEDWNWNPPEW